MKTRDRILKTSLEHFNHLGAPNVSTIEIAAQLDISPGNLYYYFKNKEDIINCHFNRFKKRILPALNHFSLGLINLTQLLDQLDFLFSLIHEYHFIFQDMHSLGLNNPHLLQKYRSLLKNTQSSFQNLLISYQQHDILVFDTPDKLEDLSQQLAFTLYYKPGYKKIIDTKSSEKDLIQQDVSAMLLLIEPHLSIHQPIKMAEQ